MKINDIMNETMSAGGTGAGGIAAMPMPMGSMIKRTPPAKKKKKNKAAGVPESITSSSIVEGDVVPFRKPKKKGPKVCSCPFDHNDDTKDMGTDPDCPYHGRNIKEAGPGRFVKKKTALSKKSISAIKKRLGSMFSSTKEVKIGPGKKPGVYEVQVHMGSHICPNCWKSDIDANVEELAGLPDVANIEADNGDMPTTILYFNVTVGSR